MNVAERNNLVCPLRTTRTPTEGQAMVRELAKALMRRFRFTRRERTILRQLVAGQSVDRIARQLDIRVTSVHKHMHRIFAKTGTEGRQPLIKLGMRLAAHRRIVGSMRLAAA